MRFFAFVVCAALITFASAATAACIAVCGKGKSNSLEKLGDYFAGVGGYRQ